MTRKENIELSIKLRKLKIKTSIMYYEFILKMRFLKLGIKIDTIYWKLIRGIKTRTAWLLGMFYSVIYSYKLCSQGWEPSFVKNYMKYTIQQMEFDPKIKTSKDMFSAFRKEMNALLD